MKQTISSLFDRLLSGKITLDEVLWVLLCGGLLFASIHLVSMLVTRWGDRNITTKSLIFSILVHVSCSLGVIAFHPPAETLANLDRPEDRIRIRRLLEDDEQRDPQQTGNTPIEQRLTDSVKPTLSRQAPVPLAIEPPQNPERRPEPMAVPDVEVPDVAKLPDEPVAIPTPQRKGETGLRADASRTLEIDEPTAEANPEVIIPSTANVRRPKVRRGQLEEPAIERKPIRGRVDRMAPKFDPANIASINTLSNPRANVKRGPEQPVIRRREGPAPSPQPAEQTGTATNDSDTGTAGGAPLRPQFSRRSTRTPQSRDDGTIERLRPDRTPSLPRPDPGPAVAVTDGFRSELPRVGPKANVRRPNFDSTKTRKRISIPSTYRLRNLANRKDFARKFGGTDASERAVEASLQWLALNQTREGSWDADRHGAGRIGKDEFGIDRRHAGIQADSGLTALAVLAFLGAGYTHEEGQYADQIDRALKWLIRQQRRDGFLGGNATHYARTYCHAMASYALAEAYGMQSDPTIDTGLRLPLRRAVKYILDTQNPSDGGWRYLKGQKSDMSIFGWQLMALKSAEIAGIRIPADAKRKMVQFLKDRSHGNSGGLASYREDEPRPTPSMTAEALFCKQMLGIKRTDLASVEAVEYLMRRIPRRSELNLYYWYYGTLAMYQFGGDSWRKWNERVRDLLVADQRTTGDNAGSWDPRGQWGPYGGRVYSTALSTLCLEVYYRFLPLYQMGGRYGEN